ncbi:MAG: hypothetical protein Q7S74_02515 [Nanoarchaeota archaeon]|nr:hypothetical protein [Nanoarchaeota archaeon]
MGNTKKQITEQEVASLFILYLTKEAQDAWPSIKKSLEDTFKERFIVTEEDMVASYDLALAVIAQDLQALKNLFPKDQAERIEKWVLKSLADTEDWGEYAVHEVEKYSNAFQKSLNNIEQYGNPINTIPVLLLYRWLGKNIDSIEVKLNGKKTGYFDPIIIEMVTHTLVMQFAGTWKRVIVTDDVELVEGDIPFDEDLSGLNNYVTESEENKPDGTIRYYDEDGNLKEKWLPPEQIKELLKKGGAKRVYRVLIKGPWDGIKETWWELSDDVIKKFVDEKDYAYATANYEKGELKYYFVSKRLWEKQEQMEEIFMDQNLSPEQQQEAVKKLINDPKQKSLFEEN